MRRRTPRLQVNTFPFLAVLLCAMGSLILVLMVMDRRAKAVARQKARDASLAGTGAFEQAVQSLTAAIHLLTARVGATPAPAAPRTQRPAA